MGSFLYDKTENRIYGSRRQVTVLGGWSVSVLGAGKDVIVGDRRKIVSTVLGKG